MAERRDPTGGIGQRVKALRRERGFRAPRDLAEAIPGGNITTAVIENIESGRKADLSVSQLLNLAQALRVPPSYLLADIRSPRSDLDLPNLSEGFDEMDSGEFDSWFAGIAGADYRAPLADERITRDQLDAYRALRRLKREIIRLDTVDSVLNDKATPGTSTSRRALLVHEADELEDYLRTSGWDLTEAQ